MEKEIVSTLKREVLLEDEQRRDELIKRIDVLDKVNELK